MKAIPHDDDVPYLRPLRGPTVWPYIAAALLAVLAWAGFYYYNVHQPARPAAKPPVAAAEPAAQPSPAAAAPAPRLLVPVEDAAALPSLDNSDTLARRSIVDLIGGPAFAELVVPDHLVRRIVATVDNLPRQTAARRLIPLNHVPGFYEPANYDRYLPYLRVLEALDVNALVNRYARAYPLFQRAYEELGYPGLYFNDRLLQAIDDMLAAPELAQAPELIRPKVLYEFADPDLETRSAGQKILLRMGPENAARVKAKLRELRAAILAASERR